VRDPGGVNKKNPDGQRPDASFDTASEEEPKNGHAQPAGFDHGI